MGGTSLTARPRVEGAVVTVAEAPPRGRGRCCKPCPPQRKRPQQPARRFTAVTAACTQGCVSLLVWNSGRRRPAALPVAQSGGHRNSSRRKGPAAIQQVRPEHPTQKEPKGGRLPDSRILSPWETWHTVHPQLCPPAQWPWLPRPARRQPSAAQGWQQTRRGHEAEASAGVEHPVGSFGVVVLCFIDF